MTWPLALRAEGFRGTLARKGRETERNRAIAPPQSRLLLASSCKQGLPCWCNELSRWAEFLQHLSCLAPWFGNVLSFKRSMRKTLQNTLIIFEMCLFLIQIGNWPLGTLEFNRNQWPPEYRRKPPLSPTTTPSIPSHTPPPPLSDSHQKAVLCELLTANVLSFYHLWHFCLSVRGQ